MANIRVEVAAATAVLGYDLLQGDLNNRVPTGRKLAGLMFTGSTAAGDCVIELMVGNKVIGKFANTSTGLVADRTKDYRQINEYVPANQLVQAFCRDAANTNPVVLEIEFTASSSGTGTFRRRTGGRRTGGYAGRRTVRRTPSLRGGMY